MTKSGFVFSKSRLICSRSRKSYSSVVGATTLSQPTAFSWARTCCPRKPPPPVTKTVWPAQKPLSLSKRSSDGGLHVIGNTVIPLMPCPELLAQSPCTVAAGIKSERLHVSVHHDADQLAKIDLRFPPELAFRLFRVGAQEIDFSRPLVAVINDNVFSPVQAGIFKGFSNKLADSVRLARTQRIVVGTLP